MHSLLLYRQLISLGKTVTVGSYSFGDPLNIKGPSAKQVFPSLTDSNVSTTGESTSPSEAQSHKLPRAFLIDASCVGDAQYCPEIGFCNFLDQQLPEHAPHRMYAYYARAFSVPALTLFYEQLVSEHSVSFSRRET